MQVVSVENAQVRGRVDFGQDATILAALALAWIALWWLIFPVGNFPLNDEWVYAYSARSIVETGRFTLPGFGAPNLVVQAYWGALFCLPFGFSFDALRISTFVLSTLGLIASYLLLREVGAARRTALFGTLTLAADPIYYQLSNTFMTDAPYLALSLISLWLYVRGAKREQVTCIVLAYAFALLALLIRQFGLLLPVAFGVAYLCRKPWRLGTLAVATLPVLAFAAVHLGFQRWVIATGRTPAFATPIGAFATADVAHALKQMRFYGLQMIPYFGLLTTPFLVYLASTHRVAGAGFWRPRSFWLLSVGLGLAILAALLWKNDLLPSFGNSLTAFGLGPLTLQDVYLKRLNRLVVPGARPFWDLLTVLGAWGTAVLALLAIRTVLSVGAGLFRWERRCEHWLQILLLTYCALYVMTILLLSALDQIFDRYLVALIIPLCAFALPAFMPRPTQLTAVRLVPAVLCLLGSAAFAIAATHDYLAWNQARWRATDLLARQGVPPSSIDGGFEFGGLYLFDPHYKRTEGVSWWFTRGDEYVITSGPLPGYVPVQRFAFSHWLWPADYSVFILHRDGSG